MHYRGPQLKRDFLDEVTLNRLLLICAAFAILALSFSFFHEYILGIRPCNLCKLQRAPMVAILALSIFGFITKFKDFSLKFVQLSFLVTLLLASYHLLVQLGLIADPCIVPKNIKNIDDFRKMLDAPIPCSKISWSLFGIPISAYSATFSLCFLIFLWKKKRQILTT